MMSLFRRTGLIQCRLRMLILLIALVASCRPIPQEPGPQLKVDSTVTGMSLDQMFDQMTTHSRRSSNSKVEKYGSSAGGRDLFLVELMDSDFIQEDDRKRPIILLTDATHGNEYLGLGERLPGRIASDLQRRTGFRKFADAGGAFVVVPVVNPDGYDYHQNRGWLARTFHRNASRGNSWGRLNGNDKDINRYFPQVSSNAGDRSGEPEVQALLTYLQNLEPRGFRLVSVIDYHCCIGNMGTALIPYGYSESARALPKDFQKKYNQVGEIFNAKLGAPFGSVVELMSYVRGPLS